MSILQRKPISDASIKNSNKYEILKILSNVRQKNLTVPDRDGNTFLHVVLANQSLSEKDIIELLEIFLDEGVDVNAENLEGKAAIHFAVERRMRGVVELLTSRNAKIDKRDRRGNSLAHHFIRDEKRHFDKFLKSDKNYYTEIPDSIARERKSASFAEFLIEKGIDFDVGNDDGQSALHLAIEHNLQHILHVLVKHTRDLSFPDDNNKSLLHLFIEKNADFRVKMAMQELSEPWYSDYTRRYAASIVRSLLDRGISTGPNDRYRNRTCLQTAIECKEDMSIIKVLVDNRLEGMDENLATSMFLELLEIVAGWGETRTKYFLKTLQSLIDRGADVNHKDNYGTTPIHRAVRGKNRRAVHFLYDRGADFRASDGEGYNLLHTLALNWNCAKRAVNEALFDLIVEKGCDNVNARGSSNNTPLHLATRWANLAIARKLIERGAEVNCKGSKCRTPLHCAARKLKNKKMAELLLESGAEVNSKDESGYRPLLLAARDMYEGEVVTMLLQWGAYVNDRDVEKSPFLAAIRRNHHIYVKQMLPYGADVSHVGAERSRSLYGNMVGWRMGKTEQLILEHWIKLKTANLVCMKDYKGFERRSREISREFYVDCSKEIETLKNTFIDDRISMYRFLHMDFGRRSHVYIRSHMYSEKLRQLVESPELEEQFPNYSDVILASYRETVLWKSLLEPAKLAWFKITGIRLPGECVEPIFAHLRNEDLVGMIEFDE